MPQHLDGIFDVLGLVAKGQQLADGPAVHAHVGGRAHHCVRFAGAGLTIRHDANVVTCAT